MFRIFVYFVWECFLKYVPSWSLIAVTTCNGHSCERHITGSHVANISPGHHDVCRRGSLYSMIWILFFIFLKSGNSQKTQKQNHMTSAILQGTGSWLLYAVLGNSLESFTVGCSGAKNIEEKPVNELFRTQSKRGCHTREHLETGGNSCSCLKKCYKLEISPLGSHNSDLRVKYFHIHASQTTDVWKRELWN